jgi:hypothetical protein
MRAGCTLVKRPARHADQAGRSSIRSCSRTIAFMDW